PLKDQDKKGYILTLVSEDHLRGILQYVWSPEEFRSDYGLRSLSKFHKEHPFFYQDRKVGYEPGESLERVKGGNSNWRGPIWTVPTFMLTQSLEKFASAFGEGVKVSYRDEPPANLHEMAQSFANGIIRIFALDTSGNRPVFGEHFPYAKDPYWNCYPLFHEYYHGETGKGLGASHQTGWSGLVANFIDLYRC